MTLSTEEKLLHLAALSDESERLSDRRGELHSQWMELLKEVTVSLQLLPGAYRISGNKVLIIEEGDGWPPTFFKPSEKTYKFTFYDLQDLPYDTPPKDQRQ